MDLATVLAKCRKIWTIPENTWTIKVILGHFKNSECQNDSEMQHMEKLMGMCMPNEKATCTQMTTKFMNAHMHKIENILGTVHAEWQCKMCKMAQTNNGTRKQTTCK